mmetsp:Transcript_2953/g.4533  ORF Transcript_2953/g.4533 Transcript_2953/m.4533 type:complete len:88 (+) Transcript_2953:219-482(+)
MARMSINIGANVRCAGRTCFSATVQYTPLVCIVEVAGSSFKSRLTCPDRLRDVPRYPSDNTGRQSCTRPGVSYRVYHVHHTHMPAYL